MIKIARGDIFSGGLEALVNPVNTRGVMGGGLARAFKLKYPLMFLEYEEACRAGTLTIGAIQVYKVDPPVWPEQPKYILNFPTKDDFRQPSRLEYIESGLKTLTKISSEFKLFSVGVPALGCGLGGLSFEDVFPLMEKYLGDTDTTYWVHLPQEARVALPI